MTQTQEIIGLALAAGKGTRMKSDLPKVLHPVGGRPMVLYVTDVMRALDLRRRIVVAGFRHELVREVLPPDVEVALQEEQLGTGHAVQCAAPLFRDSAGALLLLYGDVPLLRADTLRRMLNEHFRTHAAVTMLTTLLDDPAGYGRVMRDGDGLVSGIVEHKDATDEQRLIREINTGIYCFQIPELLMALTRLSNYNAQGEYYITDTVGILRGQGRNVAALTAEDPGEVLGINTLDELAAADRILKERNDVSDGR